MVQLNASNQLARGILSVFMVLVLLFTGCGALAGAGEIPVFSEYRKDAALEDFVGSWSLRWIRSDEAVDMRSYGYADIYPNGSVCINYGNDEEDVYFTASVEDAGNGCISVQDESGEEMFFFLFNEELLGWADTIDSPATVRYLEFSGEIDEEQPEQERIANLIYEQIGAQVFEAGEDEYAGTWRAFDYINEAGELCRMYYSGMEFEILLEGSRATVRYCVGGDETVYETPVSYESDCAVILDEYGEENRYLILREDGSLALLEDMSAPQSAIFLLTAERWEEEMAGIDYNANPQPGEQVDVESMEAIAGDWTATHINFGGLLYPAQASGLKSSLFIESDGSASIGDGSTYISAEGSIEDGLLVVSDDDGEIHYFLYSEGGLLIETDDPDDLSIVVYYQRTDDSGDA